MATLQSFISVQHFFPFSICALGMVLRWVSTSLNIPIETQHPIKVLWHYSNFREIKKVAHLYDLISSIFFQKDAENILIRIIWFLKGFLCRQRLEMGQPDLSSNLLQDLLLPLRFMALPGNWELQCTQTDVTDSSYLVYIPILIRQSFKNYEKHLSKMWDNFLSVVFAKCFLAGGGGQFTSQALACLLPTILETAVRWTWL